jgi:hypothetical protein
VIRARPDRQDRLDLLVQRDCKVSRDQPERTELTALTVPSARKALQVRKA